MSWVLAAGTVRALGIWGGDVLAPTSGTCCSRVLGQPGRAAPAAALHELQAQGTSTVPRGCVSPPAFPAFPDRFLPSRRHECPGLPPALSSRSRQDADPSSPAAAPRPPATPHPQSGRGHLAGWGGGLSPRGATCQRNCPWRRLAVAGVGCSGRWECGAGLCLCWGVPGRC